MQNQLFAEPFVPVEGTKAPVFREPAVLKPCAHTVLFYEDDSVFLKGLSEFIGSELGSGGVCLVIATRGHREALNQRLQAWGIDVAQATHSNRYIALDADDTLAKFMVDGWPDQQLFFAAIEPALLQARLGTQERSSSIVAFGEMVARLWAQGKCEAAIRLEQLWNELASRHSFTLRCAYPMTCFGQDEATLDDSLFHRICAEHSVVIPAESYTALGNDDRLRLVSSLQQKAQKLQGAIEARDREATQRKEAEERLDRALAAVIRAEKLAATGRLAATVAHEINNPLDAVTNFVYLARTSPGVPEEVREQLEIADQELARVAQITQQTLGFYRDHPRQAWVGVAGLLAGVVKIFEHKLLKKRLKIEVSAENDLQIYAREGELKQALANLIANAIDASPNGGRLRLRARSARSWSNGMAHGVRVTLADDGSGMAPEVQQRIFAPFFTTKAEAGTGIGLWMTKALIEKQGGTLRFRSRQGERPGTVMSFFLPQDSQQRSTQAESS
jgi:signal transduction histidine kinase